jgi:hypothetical protein
MAAFPCRTLVKLCSVLSKVGRLESLMSILVVRRAVVDGLRTVVTVVPSLLARANVLADHKDVVEATRRVMHGVGPPDVYRLQVNCLV